MLVGERRDLLMARLRRDGKLVARDIAQEFSLSEESVRRDLRELASAGLCQRVYGGALPLSPSTGHFTTRFALASDSKRRVAERAAKLITPASRAILGGGTTAVAVATALPPDLVATIITPNPVVAAVLVDHPNVEVFVLGGRLFKHFAIIGGAGAAEAAANISADVYLFGVAGVHPDEGLTTADPEHGALDRVLAGRAAESYVLASIEKLGTVAPYRVTGVKDVTGIVTDAAANHPVISQLRKRGANVVMVDERRRRGDMETVPKFGRLAGKSTSYGEMH